jgi:hypothetical protein
LKGRAPVNSETIPAKTESGSNDEAPMPSNVLLSSDSLQIIQI